MSETKFPSELAERFQVRMPPGLRDRLRAAAEANKRAMNTEIVVRLEQSMLLPLPPLPPDLVKRIDEAPPEKRDQALRAVEQVVLDLLNEYFPPPRPQLTAQEFAMRVAALITQLSPEQLREAKSYVSGDWEKLVQAYETDRKMPF